MLTPRCGKFGTLRGKFLQSKHTEHEQTIPLVKSALTSSNTKYWYQSVVRHKDFCSSNYESALGGLHLAEVQLVHTGHVTFGKLCLKGWVCLDLNQHNSADLRASPRQPQSRLSNVFGWFFQSFLSKEVKKCN